MSMSTKIGATHAKAWLANGLQELQSAVALGQEQVQPGQNPGLLGTVMPGEVQQERQTPAPQVEVKEMEKESQDLEL
jgi:hypothetical protein